MTAASSDRRQVRGSRRGSRLTCLGPSVQPPFERVTSACAVLVVGDGRLVLADLDRGPDLPGGHVHRGETAPEQTIRREIWEEVRARVDDLHPVEVIESDHFGAGDITYMIVQAAHVTELAPWVAEHESAGRLLYTPQEYLSRYRAGDPALMRHLVTAALAVLAAAPGPTATLGPTATPGPTITPIPEGEREL